MLWHIVLVALLLVCQLKYLVWGNSVLLEDGDLKVLRLVGGGHCEGRLESRAETMSSQYRQACDLTAGVEEAKVICRQLGCPTATAQRVPASQYGFSESINLYRPFHATCEGGESSLAGCQPKTVRCRTDNVFYAIAVRCDAGSATEFTSGMMTSSSVNVTSPLPQPQSTSRLSGILIAVLLFIAVVAILVLGTIFVMYKHRKERNVPENNVNAGDNASYGALGEQSATNCNNMRPQDQTPRQSSRCSSEERYVTVENSEVQQTAGNNTVMLSIVPAQDSNCYDVVSMKSLQLPTLPCEQEDIYDAVGSPEPEPTVQKPTIVRNTETGITKDKDDVNSITIPHQEERYSTVAIPHKYLQPSLSSASTNTDKVAVQGNDCYGVAFTNPAEEQYSAIELPPDNPITPDEGLACVESAENIYEAMDIGEMHSSPTPTDLDESGYVDCHKLNTK